MRINVTKRSGITTPLNIEKIKKMVGNACEGVEGVDPLELELESQITFIDGMHTKDIQETLIKTSVDKIDVDAPNWTFVASRLFLFDLYHNVGKVLKTAKGQPYGSLKHYLEYGEQEGKIILGLKELYDLDDLEAYIKPERDLQFNYLGIKTIAGRYLSRDSEGNRFELPQQLFMSVAMFLASKEEDNQYWAKEFYDILSKFEVMGATPTISNARKPRSQLSSCFVNAVPDNIEGIFDIYNEYAMMSKFGGGIGSDWTGIRGMSGPIDGNVGASSGPIPFLKITNSISVAVDQLGSRPAAIAVSMQLWHLNIKDFLDLKKNSGEERLRAHDLFPAVWIDNLFMERVRDNLEWSLFDPYDVEDLITLYGDDFKEQYEAYEQDSSIRRETIMAKDLWKQILRSYFETGTPFLGFKDAANVANPNKHAGTVRSSNLCVTGDTRISTQYGLVKAKELYESQVPLTCDYDIRSGSHNARTYGVGKTDDCLPMQRTKQNAKVYEVVLSNGQRMRSTAWHEYDVQRGERVVRMALKDCIVGDKLITQSGESQFGTEVDYDLDTNIKHLEVIPEHIFKGTREVVEGFLGVVFADSTIRHRHIEITHKHKEFIEGVQILLASFGIFSSIETYNNINHALTLCVESSIIFEDKIGFYNESFYSFLNTKDINTLDYASKIISIEEAGVEDVYDTTQFENHSVIFNGIATSQCQEIFQGTSPNKYLVKVEYVDGSADTFEEEEYVTTDIGVKKQAKYLTSNDILRGKDIYFIGKEVIEGDTAVCNLASVNLSKVNTREDLDRVVPIAMRMLDNVIDLNFYPIRKAKDTNLKTRAIGLGVMGEAQMLAESQIHWGSQEHYNKIDGVMERFSYNAIKASCEMAKDKGAYADFEGSDWSKGIMPFDHTREVVKDLITRSKDEYSSDWNALRFDVCTNGIRNGYMMAIAPTSSISIITGTTQAIEPIYKKKWFEENKTGLIPVCAPNISPDTWAYYTTAYDLDQTKLIEAGSIRQKWIDQGQSLNLFFTLGKASGKVLNDVYMKAWEYGLKSCYYLRSESPTAEVSDDAIMDRSQECHGCQ